MYLENHFSKNCYCNIHLLKEKILSWSWIFSSIYLLPPPYYTVIPFLQSHFDCFITVCLLFCSQFVIWIVNLCTVMNFLFCWSTNLFFLGYIYLFFLFFKCILYLISFIYAKSTDKQRFGSQAHLSIR